MTIIFDPVGSGGTGSGGLIYPDSASRPFNNVSARNTWANNNPQDLIKNTTVVNVNGNQWYLWTGPSNPPTVDSNLWMDGDQIIQGEVGAEGPKGDYGQLQAVNVVGDDFLFTDNSGNTATLTGAVTTLTGPQGDKGDTGDIGEFGQITSAEFVGDNIVFTDNSANQAVLVDATVVLKGDAGDTGSTGDTGASAYQVWVGQGNQGTEAEYLESLKGDKGDTGATGAAIALANASYYQVGQDQYLGLDRIVPAYSGTAIPTGRLVNIVGEDPLSGLIEITDVPRGAFAVGVALNANGQLFSATSGVFSGLLTGGNPGDIVYVGDFGELTFQQSDYIIGEMVGTEILIDIDLYRSQLVNPDASSLNPLNIDGNATTDLVVGDGLSAAYDDATTTTTISADPLLIDGEITKSIITGSGIVVTHDPITDEATLNIDVDNVDLSGYAELDTDVSFSKVSIKDESDPLYESFIDVTTAGDTLVSLVGSTNIVKTDKGTGAVTEVMTINDTTGAVNHKTEVIVEVTRDAINSVSSLQVRNGDGQVMLGSVIQEQGSSDEDFIVYLGDTTQSGAVQNLESTIAKFSEGRTYGFGEGAILSVNQTVIDDRRRYIIGATTPDSMTLTISNDLEGCRLLIESIGSEDANFTTLTVAATGQTNLVFDIGRNDKWIVEYNRGSTINAYRVKDGAESPAVGLGGMGLAVNEAVVRPFQFVEGMPYHLLYETPTSSRLINEFHDSKSFVFSPNATARSYASTVVVNETNQSVTSSDLALGEYGDFPLYIMEPNVVINRDQRASVSLPANMTIDISEGFYTFGTISGRCGNGNTSGTANVYIGTGENSRSPFGCIGFRIADDGLYILDGTSTATKVGGGGEAIQFRKTGGLTNFYRFAVYVDAAGLMTFYIVSLNDGVLATGTQQCVMTNIQNNPKLWMTYDRLGNSTSCIAIGETHLVLNYKSDRPEGLWNWRF